MVSVEAASLENFALAEALRRVVHIRENSVLAAELVSVAIGRFQEVGVRVQRRQTLLVGELRDALATVYCLLVQDAQGLAGLVLEWLVRDDIVGATRAIIDIVDGYWPRLPRLLALGVLSVTRLGHHLVVHGLEGPRLLGGFETHVVRHVPGESFSGNSQCVAVELRIVRQPHLVSVSGRTEGHLSCWDLD